MVFYAIKLRALAIVAVLMIHVTARLVKQEVGTIDWWIGNILNSSSRWSVPLFFMLSGMFLLEKRESQTEVLKKRVMKLILPLLLWSIIYSLWKVRYDIDTYSFKQTFVLFLQDDIKYHLWYMYAILGLYLCIPLFKAFIQMGKKIDILYFIFLSFLISAITHTIALVFDIQLAGGFEYFLGYGGYFLLGHYLANNIISKKQKIIIFILGTIALVTTIVGTWFFTLRDGRINEIFYDYLSFTTPIVAISIFVLFKHYANKRCSKLTEATAKHSLGIYLMHPIFLDVYRSKEFIEATGISAQTSPAYLYVACVFLLVYSTSLILSIIISKIPIIKSFV